MAKKIIVLAVVLALGGGCWLVWYFSDSQVIKRQLVALAEDLSKEPQEPAVQMALKLRDAKDMLADTVEAEVPQRNYQESLERDLIIQYLLYHRQRHSLLSVVFADVILDFPGKDQAQVTTRVELSRQKMKTEKVEEVTAEVVLELSKGEDNWLIKRAVVGEDLTL